MQVYVLSRTRGGYEHMETRDIPDTDGASKCFAMSEREAVAHMRFKTRGNTRRIYDLTPAELKDEFNKQQDKRKELHI